MSQNSFLALILTLILNLILALGWLWAGYGLLLLINYDKLPFDNGELQKDSTATWGEHSLGLDVAFWESPRGPPRILFPFFHKKKNSTKISKKSQKFWRKSFTIFFETKFRIYLLFRGKSGRPRSKLLKNVLIFCIWGTCFSATRFFSKVFFGSFRYFSGFFWIFLSFLPPPRLPGPGFSYTIMHVRVCWDNNQE